MANGRRAFRALAVISLLTMLAACASKPPEDVVLKGSVQAVQNVNPDSEGRPSPLVIKVFQLKAKDKFESADFFPLFDEAQATLGADMLAVEEMMLAPGDFRPYEGKFDPQTRFIGVIAAYRDINQAKWKTILEMPEKGMLNFFKGNGITIKAESLAIDVSVDD
jgi:type VI secretion system protein VasD